MIPSILGAALCLVPCVHTRLMSAVHSVACGSSQYNIHAVIQQALRSDLQVAMEPGLYAKAQVKADLCDAHVT